MLTEEQIEVALSETAELSGCYNFLLVMDNDGVIEYHPRHNQPCQGGEMRKYDETHTDCTRPQDERPGDLEDPFPDGTPLAVGVHFDEEILTTEFGDALMSSVSPYKKILKENRVVLYPDGKWIQDILFLDLDVDSTAFVNLLQAMRSNLCQSFSAWKTSGFSVQESIWGAMLLSSNPWSEIMTEPECNNYYFPVKASLRRLRDGDFHDLTGGTFKDRYDYNRPNVQDLFKAKGDDIVTNLGRELSERKAWEVRKRRMYGHEYNCHIAGDKFCDIAHEIFSEGLKG